MITGPSGQKAALPMVMKLALAAFILVPSPAIYAQTISTFDVLVATGNLTVVGTTTVQGSQFSVGGSSLVVNQGQVGVATTTPAGLFSVGNGTLTVLGSGFVGIGTATPVALLNVVSGPIQGFGTQFQWIASKAALRAGEIDGTQWNSIPNYSVAFGFDNTASGTESFVGSGNNNSAQNTAATIAGGSYNVVSGASGFIGGGSFNSAGFESVVTGGDESSASGNYSFVGGGAANHATGLGSVIAGGGLIPPNVESGNTASGTSSAILGGVLNQASGDYSAVPGGYNNSASGKYSFAAGQSASAQGQGSFVWADSQNSTFASNLDDEFKIRAKGGYVLYSTWTAPTVIVSSGAILISTSATMVSAVPNLFISSGTGEVGIGTSLPRAKLDVKMAPENSFALTISSADGVTGMLAVDRKGVVIVDDPSEIARLFGTALSVGGYGIYIGTADPVLRFDDQTRSANNRVWDMVSTGGQLVIRTLNDAGSGASNAIVMTRAGNNVTQTTFDNGNVGIATTQPATTLDTNGNAQFGLGTAKSTFTITGALNLASNASLTLVGTSGNITTQSSATASAFFGDGSHLTGLLSTASANSTFVAKAGDAMTGQLTLSASTLTVGGAALSVGGSSFTIGGGSATVAYQMNAQTFNATSSVTANSFFGDGSHLTGISSGGDVTLAGPNAMTGNDTRASGGSYTQLQGSTLTFSSGAKLDIQAGAAYGFSVMVASADAASNATSQISTITFTLSNYLSPAEVDASSIAWTLKYDCKMSSTAWLVVAFNSDLGAHYNYATGTISNTGSSGAQGGLTEHGIGLNSNTAGASGSWSRGSLDFSTSQENTSNTSFDGTGKTSAAGSYRCTITGGLYTGTGVMTSVNFTSSSVDTPSVPDHKMPLHCHVELWRNGFQHL